MTRLSRSAFVVCAALLLLAVMGLCVAAGTAGRAPAAPVSGVRTVTVQAPAPTVTVSYLLECTAGRGCTVNP